MPAVSSPDALNARAQQRAAAKTAAQPATDVLVERRTLKLREAKPTGSTGQELDNRGRPTGREQPQNIDETKDKEVELRYTNFLTNHLVRLAEAIRDHPEIKDKIRPRHQGELTLLEAYSREDGTLDEEAIKKYLTTSAGRFATTLIIEELSIELSGALGFNPAINPKGTRVLTSQKMNMPLGEQSIFRSFIHSLKHRREVFSTPLEKDRGLGFEPNQEVFDAIKADPAERDYFRHVFNLDIEHLRLTGGKLEVIPGETLRSNRDFADLQKEATQLYYARRAFFDSLNVPLAQLDAGPHQYLLARISGTTGIQQEMNGVKFEKAVSDRFEELGGVYTAGTAVEQIQRTLERQSQARQEVMGRLIAESLSDVLSKSRGSERSELAKKKTATTNPDAIAKRTKEFTDKKEKLEQEKTALEARKSFHSPYEQKKATAGRVDEAERETLFNECDISFPAGSDFLTVIGTEITNVDNKLNTDNIDIPRAAGPVTVHGINGAINYYLAQRAEIEREIVTATLALPVYAALTPKAKDNIEERISREVTNQINHLKEQRTELKGRKTKILASRKRYEDAKKELQQAEKEIVDTATKELNEMARSYDTLVVTTPPHPGTQLTTTELETLDLDQIVEKITNPAGAYRLAYTTEDEKTAVRKLVAQAKTEQRARQVETYDAGNPTDIASFNVVTLATGAPITPNDLLTMPDQQLLHILITHTAYAGLGRPASDVLPEAQREARRKLRIRDKIYIEEQGKNLDTQIKEQDKLIKEKGGVTAIEEAIAVADTAMGRRGEVISQAYTLVHSNTERIKALTDITLVTNTDIGYSVEEKAAGLPKGYYDLLNIFFDYQDKDMAVRGQNFEKLRGVLSPDKLADLLNIFVGYGLGPPPPTLSDVLTDLGDRLRAGNIGPDNLHRGFEDVINRLYTEAKVI